MLTLVGNKRKLQRDVPGVPTLEEALPIDLGDFGDSPMTPYAPGTVVRLRSGAPGARWALVLLRIIVIPCLVLFAGGMIYYFVDTLIRNL